MRLASKSISWRDIELHRKIVSLVVGDVAPRLAGTLGQGGGLEGLEVNVQLLLVLLDLTDLHV